MHTLGCAAYVFLHKDQHHDALSPHAELMTFIGYADGIKGWKFMRSTNVIFMPQRQCSMKAPSCTVLEDHMQVFLRLRQDYYQSTKVTFLQKMMIKHWHYHLLKVIWFRDPLFPGLMCHLLMVMIIKPLLVLLL